MICVTFFFFLLSPGAPVGIICPLQLFKAGSFTVWAVVLYPRVYSDAIFSLAHAASPELVVGSLGWFPLESGLMGGLQDSMWLVLNNSAATDISQVVAGGFEPASSLLVCNIL